MDLYVLEELYLNSPAGTIVDFISWLIYGRGIKPILKLRNPKKWGDEKAQLEQIKANEGLLDPLIDIDNSVGNSDDDSIGHEHTLKQKLQGLCKMALTFGKGALIRIVDDEGYFLIPFHPKDMTFNILDEKQRLRAILTPIHDEPYEAKDLIYAEYNAVNPKHNSLYHGMALIHRMIDPARTYRRIVGTDFRLIAKKRWQDNYWAAIAKRDGKKDAANIMKKIAKGDSIVTEENDPDKDVKIHTIPNKSDSSDIIEMKRDSVRDMLQIAGIPEPLFFSEKSSNYATLIGFTTVI
ncbi:MAG: hypothetical protein HRU07_06700 [Nitrosopumilus sp.]|nr:hypothetical protein [Nitrosopumilus sp.]